MKYDRPVRELLGDCVSALPQPFAKTDVFRWFRENYPDVAESTISTHISGLTVGTRPHEHLAQFAPIVERVGRGLYRRAAAAPAVLPLPAPAKRGQPTAVVEPRVASHAASGRIVLVGCVKSKQSSATVARDLYTSALFARRRAYAEATGDPWFIVSARLGLILPDELIAPYDSYLPGKSARYRTAWGEFVAAQLAEVAQIRDVTIEIHAGDAYVSALRCPLEALGGWVADPVIATSMGATLAWYDTKSSANAPALTDRMSQSAGIDSVDEIADALSSSSNSRSVAELLATSPAALAAPGMYSWWVDEEGALDLTAGLGHPVSAGLIYAGQAGATRWPSGRRSTNTLWGRLHGMHLGAKARFSTFRLTLASILQPDADGDVDEAALTDWMIVHLRMVAMPMDDGDRIDEIETAVLARLDPPLNLAKRPPTPLRQTLSARRKQLGVR